MIFKTIYIFPLIIITIDLLASLFYFFSGDVKKGIYWLSAAILTTTVTF